MKNDCYKLKGLYKMGTSLFCIELIYPYLYFIVQLYKPVNKNILGNSKNGANLPYPTAVTDHGIGCLRIGILAACAFWIFSMTSYDLLSLWKITEHMQLLV